MSREEENEVTSSSSPYYDTLDCWTDENHTTHESSSWKNLKSMVTPDAKRNCYRTYRIIEPKSQGSSECLNSASFKNNNQSIDTYNCKKTLITEFISLKLDADANKDKDSIGATDDHSMSTILAGNSAEKPKQRKIDSLSDNNLHSTILAGRLISADESDLSDNYLECTAIENISLLSKAIDLSVKEPNNEVQDNMDNILELNILESTCEDSLNENDEPPIENNSKTRMNLVSTNILVDLPCTDDVEVLSSDKSINYSSCDANVQDKICPRMDVKDTYLTHKNIHKRTEDDHVRRNGIACENVMSSREDQQSNNCQRNKNSVTVKEHKEPMEKPIETDCTNTNHNIKSNSNHSNSAPECNFESICTKSELMATENIKIPKVNCLPFIEDCHTSTPVKGVVQDTFDSIDESTILKSFQFLKQCHSPFEKYFTQDVCQTKDNNTEESKSIKSTERFIKRLSQDFSSSPKKFTERLVTIIEESAMHNCDSKDVSGVSLSRITEEFRKICKRIEDESIPEWAPSLNINSPPKHEMECSENSYHITLNIENSDCSVMKRDVECEKLKRKEHASRCIVCTNEKSVMSASSSKRLQKLNSDKNTRSKVQTKISARNTNISKSSFYKDNSYQATNINSCSEKRAIKNERCNMNDTDAFLIWEDICNVLCDTKQSDSQDNQEKSTSLNSVASSKDDIMIICERQMASLDDTRTKIKSEIITDSSVSQQDNDTFSQTNSNYESNYASPYCTNRNSDLCLNEEKRNQSTEKTKQLSEESREQTYNVEQIKSSNHADYLPIYEDELEKSLLLELVEKRQRCFDMAEKMIEIRDDPAVMQAKMSLENFPELKNVSFSSNENDARFFNTLTSCMDYHTYITNKSRPLHDMLERLEHVEKSVFHSHDDTLKRPIDTSLMKKIFSIKASTGGATDSSIKIPVMKVTEATPVQTLNEKVNLLKLKDMMSPERNINCAKKLSYTPQKTPKYKYFFTPGKSPTYGKVKKKPMSYFSSPKNTPAKKLPPNITKSLHTPGLYRSNYNTVLSPVGMYIKGTDVSFIRTITPKTSKKLLTPKSKSQEPLFKANKSSKTVSSGSKTSLFKFKLSPQQNCKQKKQQNNQSTKKSSVNTSPLTGIKNISTNNFALPKVAYKQARQKCTLNEVPESPQRRLKGLLQSEDDKVVVRHEARFKVQREKTVVTAANDSSVPESLISDSADYSLHVEKVAQKTNFIGNKKAC